MKNFDPNRVFRDVKNRTRQSFFKASQPAKDKPLPQPAPPSFDEIQSVLDKDKKEKGSYGVMEISFKNTVPVVKERVPYKGDRIHNQVFGVFKMLSCPGARRFQVRC